MNKISTALFLLFVALATFTFAEDSPKAPSQAQSRPFTHYLSVLDIEDNGLVLVLNDGSKWDIKYFGGAWKLFGWGWTEQERVSHWEVGDTIEIQYPGSGNYLDFILIINNISKNDHAL